MLNSANQLYCLICLVWSNFEGQKVVGGAKLSRCLGHTLLSRFNHCSPPGTAPTHPYMEYSHFKTALKVTRETNLLQTWSGSQQATKGHSDSAHSRTVISGSLAPRKEKKTCVCDRTTATLIQTPEARSSGFGKQELAAFSD